MSIGFRLGAAPLLSTLALLSPACREPPSDSAASETGIDEVAASAAVIEEVVSTGAGARAGLRAGDHVIAWRTQGETRPGGTVEGPLDLDALETEEAPRGDLVLEVRRSRELVSLSVPAGNWELVARPVLTGDELARYREGQRQLDEDQPQLAAASWRALAAALTGRRETRLAGAWLWSRIGAALAGEPESAAAFAQAGEFETAREIFEEGGEQRQREPDERNRR